MKETAWAIFIVALFTAIHYWRQLFAFLSTAVLSLTLSGCVSTQQAVHFDRIRAACYQPNGEQRTDLDDATELSCFDRYCDYKMVWNGIAKECVE